MTINDGDGFIMIVLLGWIGYSLAKIAKRLEKPIVTNQFNLGYGTALQIDGKVVRSSVLTPSDHE